MKSELSSFLPYLLNQAAETVSHAFQAQYRDRYGMLRTEWRVLFHLGRHGEMTAKQICTEAILHKTKVSRAVAALEQKRYLKRRAVAQDRRSELLVLTKAGEAVFADLSEAAAVYDHALETALGAQDMQHLKAMLARLIEDRTPPPG
jgi:DNA-binding MarR family transcriptional regulator